MNFDEAAALFQKQKKEGLDPVIVKVSQRGEANDPSTRFVVKDRLTSIEEDKKKCAPSP